MNFFGRLGSREKNQINQSMAALIGITQGILGDGILTDAEIRFLEQWISNNETIQHIWPADIVFSKLKWALDDGVITEEERTHLIEVLQKFVGGDVEHFTEKGRVTELAFDEVDSLSFEGKRFCLTGDFVFAPRAGCHEAIEQRGGLIEKGVTKKLNYLVIGSIGSDEWKHGSFGRKIEKAAEYRSKGIPLLIVSEDIWAGSL